MCPPNLERDPDRVLGLSDAEVMGERLAGRVELADQAEDPVEREHRLHEARKAAAAVNQERLRDLGDEAAQTEDNAAGWHRRVTFMTTTAMQS